MEETKYLEEMNDIYLKGDLLKSRNYNTLSKFGKFLEFDVSEKFPLLTTKKVFLRGIIEELLWFIKADTNVKHLKEKKVHIWDKNSSREYLDSIGLNDYEEDCAGPIYGFQWRHFDADYKGVDGDYSGQGVDQLQNCIDLINNDPYSRRIFMSGWNPKQLKEMCLPPCHVSYQFNVSYKDDLDLVMYQRSGDMFLGVPFNIASSALLLYMVAHVTNKKPRNLKIVIGNAHIYENHLKAVREQLNRKPYEFPKLNIKNKRSNINDFVYDDFELINYECHNSIKAEMIA